MRLAYLIIVLPVLAAFGPVLAEPLRLELPPTHITSRCLYCGIIQRPRGDQAAASVSPPAALRHAAASGNSDAQTRLGDLYYHAPPPGKDKTAWRRRGLRWLTRAAKKDYAPAQEQLIDIYDDETSPDYAPEKAHAWQVRMAEHGDVTAMIALGINYEMGDPGPPDYQKAAYWYGRAVEAGSFDTMIRLASLYERETPAGLPPFQDIKKAACWYERAAAKDCAYCMRRLARIYDSNGPHRDIIKAVHWYTLLANENLSSWRLNSYEMRRLGELYAAAPEVKDEALSFNWYEKAAQAGDNIALNYMCGWKDRSPDLFVRTRQACAGIDAAKVAQAEDAAIAMLTGNKPDDTTALPLLIRAMWEGGQQATDYLGQYATGLRGTPEQTREAARQIWFAASQNWPRPAAWMTLHGDIAATVRADELDLSNLPPGYVMLEAAGGDAQRQVSLAEGLRDILIPATDYIEAHDLDETRNLTLSLACQWSSDGWFRACTPISPARRYSLFDTDTADFLTGNAHHVQPGNAWKALSAGKWSIIQLHAPLAQAGK